MHNLTKFFFSFCEKKTESQIKCEFSRVHLMGTIFLNGIQSGSSEKRTDAKASGFLCFSSFPFA